MNGNMFVNLDKINFSEWCINTGKYPQHHNGQVFNNEIYIKLFCADDNNGSHSFPRDNPQKKFIGSYYINLVLLENVGFVRRDGNGYRLRFVIIDKIVYIQIKNNSPKLPIGNI